MIPFNYRKNALCCELADLMELAQTYETPLYVYSRTGILNSYFHIDQAFSGIDHVICYALKANSNPILLRMLADAGAGADVVSGGELKLALEAGFDPGKIVYASVGKTDAEITSAIDAGIAALNVESVQELEVTARIAAEAGTVAEIALRLNPDIDIEGHPYITTGRIINKFGIDISRAREHFIWGNTQPALRMAGVHAHIGSMISTIAPYKKMAETLTDFVLDLRRDGIDLTHIDIGGGLGVDYTKVTARDGSPYSLDLRQFAEHVIPVIAKTACRLFFEPGRAITGPNGALITRVLFTKEIKGKNFVVVDAAMNDLIRPALYGAHHKILPLLKKRRETMRADVVGPICESGDFLAKDIDMPAVQRGDYLAIMTAGAYGFVLASNYNQRPRPAEVLVSDSKAVLIRERERL